jgi:hypothetical protein
MAIQINLASSQYGIPFNGAYFRIATASISRQRSGGDNKFSVMIDVVGYGTATPGDDTREVDFRRYHAPLDEVESKSGNTFLQKCYNWIMLQPDMSGSLAV